MEIDKNDATEVAQAVAAFLSSNRERREEFLLAMARQHRTIQQLFTDYSLAWLRYVATFDRDQYDGRNEDSVRVAKQLAPHIDDAMFGCERLPYV